MIKLLISDLDGTLIHNHATMKDEDLNALKMAMESGLELAFASGRMYPEIRSVMEELGKRTHAISQNGAFVHTTDGSMILQEAFDPGLQRALMEAGEGTPFLTLLCAPDYYFVERMSGHAERIAGRLMAPMRLVPDARERLGRDIVSGKMSFFGGLDALRSFRERLMEAYGDSIDAYISDIDCMDVMPHGVSKGTGAEALLKHLGLGADEAVCVGDSFNDLSMFAAIRHSFAMEGAHPDVRAKASRTTDGVAAVVAWAMESSR